MNDFARQIKGKRVLVFGLGRQGGGQGDADWLAQHGATVKVSDQDRTLVPAGQQREDIDWAEIIIKNPGVADAHPDLLYANSLGKPVLTSIAVFVKYAAVPIIGVTGTRGKSTTTALITSLLNQAFPGKIITGGNIPGTSGLSLFDQEEGKQYAVLELSSFQLHNFHALKVSPTLAVITNLYPDHLNRYPDMESYRLDKTAIVAYQRPSDVTLVNADNAGALAIAAGSPGQLIRYSAQEVAGWPSLLPGSHNRENLAAMAGVGRVLGLQEALARRVAAEFTGLPFRQEVIREVNGVTYINDTTASTPVAAIKAIEAQTKPTILICGGASKNLPTDNLVRAIVTSPQINSVIILGSKDIPDFVGELTSQAKSKVLDQVSSMTEAIHLAQAHAKRGSVVLLSPGFSSFDLFNNEFERGTQFNAAVKAL